MSELGSIFEGAEVRYKDKREHIFRGGMPKMWKNTTKLLSLKFRSSKHFLTSNNQDHIIT
jgi:hypothetical protein